MYKVTLTQDQCSKLSMALQLTTQHRKEERDRCERLGSELNESGALKYPHMTANAEWWAETEIALQGVLVALDRAEEETDYDAQSRAVEAAVSRAIKKMAEIEEETE